MAAASYIRICRSGASAATRRLIEEFKLPADMLVAVGYGKQRLKHDADPTGGENRRAQIVDLQN